MTEIIYILLQWHGDGIDTEIKVGTESWPEGRKFLCRSGGDLNLQHFDHESGALPLSYPCSTAELSLLYHWAIPALPLSYPCSTTELSWLALILICILTQDGSVDLNIEGVF